MKTTLTDGSPVPSDGSHKEIQENGQQKGYVVLSEEDRRRGYVEPLRFTYVHLTCGGTTTMGREIAETYAVTPEFYSGTFCFHCKGHFPVGEKGEFLWDGTDQLVGTRQSSHA